MMPVTSLDVFITVGLLSLWVLFPIGLFISMGRLDKDTDQVDHIEHGDTEEKVEEKKVA